MDRVCFVLLLVSQLFLSHGAGKFQLSRGVRPWTIETYHLRISAVHHAILFLILKPKIENRKNENAKIEVAFQAPVPEMRPRFLHFHFFDFQFFRFQN